MQLLSSIRNVIKAKNILVDSADAIVKSLNESKLSICLQASLPKICMEAYINSYHNQLTNVFIQFSNDQAENILVRLRKHEIDLGIIVLPRELGDLGREISFQPIYSSSIALACHKTHPLNH